MTIQFIWLTAKSCDKNSHTDAGKRLLDRAVEDIEDLVFVAGLP
jgi:hypothetical protein